MKNKILVGLAVAILLTAVVWTGYAQKEGLSNTSYEYQVIEDPTRTYALDEGIKQLNQLGTQGWEIVGLDHGYVYLKRISVVYHK